ncbi:tripartite tricarboxylate transporter permease [Natrinema soli]|uniref:Tripartite tricarboxylate transporter permease n=1 Tax=Natrinema soli TaxID=1930624 RepID=A0ABD5SYW7_9EURY|nr:tripartite tricarboxylate transporter permease [Natrinema soli]
MTELLLEPIVLQQTGDLWEAMLIAFDVVTDPYNFLLLLISVAIGLIVGILPGLGGPIALALLIPVTFQFDGNVAVMILSGTLGATAFGGSITAILLNTPGDAPNAATLLDGYPMTRQGRGGEALAASAISSASGAFFGLALLLISIPFVRSLALAFGSPEMFWLAIAGLTTVALATRGSVLTDLIAGAFGLMLAFHGLNPVTGTARFTYGTTYLFDGIQLIPLIIGLFAIAEMIKLMGEQQSIAGDTKVAGGLMKGTRSVVSNWKLVGQSSIIGWIIGIIPGAGGTVANFISYMTAKQRSSESSSFGEGNIKGVIASEAANDSKDGGSMIPTLGLGVPGSASTAVLLGAFIIHGVTPGPLLFQENLQLVFVVIFALLISNALTSTIGLLTANTLTKITRIRITTVAPIVVMISLLGAFAIRGNINDVVLAVGFGVIGALMMKYGMSRVAVVVALILGPLAEQNFHRSLQVSQGDYAILFTQPLSIALILITVLMLAVSIYQSRRAIVGP